MGISREFLTFAGKSSLDFNVWISGSGTFNAPARDIETVAIPGRNGLIQFDNGRFNNIDVTYPAFIARNFSKNLEAFRAWLLSQSGYQRLEDSYHPDEFRLASFKAGLNVAAGTRNLGGTFDLVFDCKPQRFLKAGEFAMAYNSKAVVYNPTRFAALPLILVTGSGTLTLNGTSMTVTGNSGNLVIDCELQEAYADGVGKNSLVTSEFPRLDPGENQLTYSGFSKFEIIPRWWTI